jgi:hypothetical protein
VNCEEVREAQEGGETKDAKEKVRKRATIERANEWRRWRCVARLRQPVTGFVLVTANLMSVISILRF